MNKIFFIILIYIFGSASSYASEMHWTRDINNKCLIQAPLLNSAHWSGRCLYGKASGYGKVSFSVLGKVTKIVESKYVNGVAHGSRCKIWKYKKGVLSYRAEGNCVNDDLREDYVKLYFYNSRGNSVTDTYFGSVKNGKRHGFGTQSGARGYRSGYWDNNRFFGKIQPRNNISNSLGNIVFPNTISIPKTNTYLPEPIHPQLDINLSRDPYR